MSDRRTRNGGEVDVFTIETYVQFEDTEKLPVILNRYDMVATVGETKEKFLKREKLDVGLARPDDIIMSLILPGRYDGDPPTEMELDETEKVTEYVDDFTCCTVIKMKRRERQ